MEKTKKTVKVRYIVIAVVAVLLCVGIVFGVRVLKSPEYALLKIAQDVKENGIDGLMPHLTGDANETVSKIKAISENEILNSILSLFGKDDYTGVLKSKLNEVEWSLSEILEGNEHAEVVLNFNYQDKLVGTIDIEMTYGDDGWKISGLDMPKFDKVEWNT